MSAPGWYPDPNGQPYQRWWDGTQWTEQTQAQQQTQQQTPPGYAQQPWGQAQQSAYPTPYGQQGVYFPSNEARQWALFAHLSGLIGGFLGPMIIYLIKKDDDPFIADQSREALNFQLALLIAIFVCIILIFLIVGIFLLPVVAIGAFVFQIIAAVQANKGVWYRYPVTIRFING